MDNLAADFEINPNNPLNAEYELGESASFDCSFELYASGTVWGSIDGDINNQTDLINLLNTKVDLTSFEELSQTVEDNYNELTDDISDLTTTVTDNYNTLRGQISDLTTTVNNNYISLDNRLTTAEGSILDLTDTVDDNYTELNGKITTTNNNISTLSQTVQDNNTAINNRVDGIVDSFDGDISDLNNAIDNLSDTVADNYTDLDGKITNLSGTVSNNYTELNGKITDNTDDITTIQNTINSYGDIVSYNAVYFATANQGALADTALQPNDNISELVNDVGYITSASLPTVNNATIVIQKNGSSVGTFTLNQANNATLNITVPTQASDIGAMPDTTTIEDLTTTAQLNALNSGATTSNIGQISTNQNNIADIRSLIPLQASTSNQLADKGFVNSSIATNTANFIGTFNSVAELEAYSGTLTNNDYAFVATTDSAGNTLYDRYKYNADTQEWLFEYELNNSSFTAQQWASINSGITSGDVTLIGTALQPNDNISELINDAGYITSASLPTNYVTTNTAQNISGRKTFLGEKAIYFKQNVAADKLGFTLYSSNNTELGALEYRPNTINGNALLALNCSQSGSNYVGFRYWSGINIVAPRPTTNGIYYIPVNFTDGTNTVTANNNGTLNISTLLPDVSNFVTNSSLATTLEDYQPLLVSGTNIKTINNNSILGSGNLTLDGLPSQTGQSGKFLTTDGTDASWATITTPTVDQTFDGTSANAQSGVAIAGAGFLQNTATGSDAITILGNASNKTNAINIGVGSNGTGTGAVAIGKYASASQGEAIAIGYGASATASRAIQLGAGTNSTAYTFSVGLGNNNYQLLDGTTGLIPDARISSNIARTSDVPTESTVSGWGFTKNTGTVTSVNNIQPVSGNVTITIPTDTSDLTNGAGYITSSALTPYVLSSSLATVATTGDYDDLTNKPTIPTVNNGTLTIQKNGTTVGTFTANASNNVTANISVPTSISDLTDDTSTYPIDKAESVVDNNSGSLTFWSGTKAQYDAIVTKDANTLYNVEDTTSPIISILDSLYPVGSIYIGTMSACPLQTLGVGTWQLVATDKVLQGAGTRGSVGTAVNESLPNITGGTISTETAYAPTLESNMYGAFILGTNGASTPDRGITAGNFATYSYWYFDASASNSTYQNNAPVQQDAYLVNIWERIS